MTVRNLRLCRHACVAALLAEISAFLSAADKREFLIVRAETFFDQVVEPVDLLGPDTFIDPLLRATIRPLVGRV